MKPFILIVIILALSAFKGSILDGQKNTDNSLLIKKIKSTNSYFIIYAERNDSLFKIVSKKTKHKNQECTKLTVGHQYTLVLHSNIPEVDGVKLMPVNYLDVKTIFSLGQSVWSIEPKKGIFDTFHAENIQGLCLKE